MICYRFALCDDFTGMEFMGTEVDDPNPQIDAEFWNRFMQGNCTMVYRGEVFDDTNEGELT